MGYKHSNELFFIAAFLTVIVIRSAIYLSRYFMPETHLIYKGYIIHHFWFGFIFILISLLVSSKYLKMKSILLGAGFGPIIDELVFMIYGGGGYSNYWSLPSVLGMMLCLIVVFVFRRRISYTHKTDKKQKTN